jgi:hypothetical protein
VKFVGSFLTDADRPGSLAHRARAGRWEQFANHFPDVDQMRVLDLGGTASSWLHAPTLPRELTILNLVHPSSDGSARLVSGDACDPPRELAGERFDLVFSNSVIDQVGGHQRRGAFAEQVHTLAPAHWVQTAYRYFPLDPYFLFPGFASLPVAARRAILCRWPVTIQFTREPMKAIEHVLRVELLSRTELRYYFPTSEIMAERMAGLTKSLIAVRR